MGENIFVGASYCGGVGCFLVVFKHSIVEFEELFSFVLIAWFTQFFGSILFLYFLSFM